MRWAARRQRGARRGPAGRAGHRQPAQGFTLIEVGLVVGVLALLAVLVSDFYVQQLNLRYTRERADGAVRDMRQIMDAALAWRDGNVNGFWPNDATRIDIDQLTTDGYLPRIPPNRYGDCRPACGQYELLGWDRDFQPRGRYTDDFMEAEDLIVRVDVWGGDAHGIAAQLPLGEAFRATTAPTDQRYRVEARLAYDGFGDRFVRLRNEGRALAFGQVVDDTDEPLPVGDLRGVARIAWQRDIPVDADGNELDLYQREGDGDYKRRPRRVTTPGRTEDLPIVALPQGADPEDDRTGTGITLDEERVTVHGRLWVRDPAERDRPEPPWDVGERIALIENDIIILGRQIAGTSAGQGGS